MHTYVSVPRFLKLKDAAAEFSVSVKALRGAIASNALKAYHPNGHALVVKAEDVVHWITSSGYRTRITRRHDD